MANGKGLFGDIPAWAQALIKAGGWGVAIVLFIFGIALPMRDDFNDFKAQVGADMKDVKAELRLLNDTVLSAVRERITRAEKDVEALDRRIAALEKKG